MSRNADRNQFLAYVAFVAWLAGGALSLSIARGQEPSPRNELPLATRPVDQEFHHQAESDCCSPDKAARGLIEKAEYEQAMQTLEKILLLDPDDEWAIPVRELIRERVFLKRGNGNRMEERPLANRVIQEQLDRILPELSFEGVTFGDVVEFLCAM